MWKKMKRSLSEYQMSIAELLKDFLPDIMGEGRFQIDKIEADNEGPFVCDGSDYLSSVKLKYHRLDSILAKADRNFWVYQDAGSLEKELQMTVITKKGLAWWDYYIEIIDGLEI